MRIFVLHFEKAALEYRRDNTDLIVAMKVRKWNKNDFFLFPSQYNYESVFPGHMEKIYLNFQENNNG